MKILMSAYNCSPYRGSECALGWNNAFTAASFGHEITVITNEYYRYEIEQYCRENTNDALLNICFLYIKIPFALIKIQGYVGELIQYRYFQQKVVKVAKIILKNKSFDFVQHTSWSSLFQKIYLYKLDIPIVVGPVGGGEETPADLMGNYHFKNKLKEFVRKMAVYKTLHSKWFKKICSKSLVIFVTTDETYKCVPEKYRYKTYVKQAIGINLKETVDEYKNDVNSVNSCNSKKRLRLLMVGRLIYWKGFDLGIRAIKQLIDKGFDVELHIIGNGKERSRLEVLCGKWLNERIFFHGNVPYTKLNQVYTSSDVLINTSLHDSGCTVVLEAMVNSLPVVCIDTGGPKVLTNDECAIKVVPDTPNKTVENIENAIKRLLDNPDLCKELGNKARIRAENEFDYTSKFKSIESIIVKHMNR